MNAKSLALIGGVVLVALIVYGYVIQPQLDKQRDSAAGATV